MKVESIEVLIEVRWDVLDDGGSGLMVRFLKD